MKKIYELKTWLFVFTAFVGLVGLRAQTVVHWKIDNLTSIGGNKVTVYGDPQIVVFDGETDSFTAVEFDGVDDGIIIDGNPLIGATEFTAEVVFWPDDLVGQDPRFVHFQQDDNNRVTIELRNLVQGEWYLDTFIKSGASSLTLIDEKNTHPTQQWQHTALVYSGGKMKHYVNGLLELEGNVTYAKMSSGQVSVGMRMNFRNYLKGKIKEIRVTHKALDPSAFLTADGSGNLAPVVANPLPDLEKPFGENFEVDLTNVFSDPDGDELLYAAESSNILQFDMYVQDLKLGFKFNQNQRMIHADSTTTITVSVADRKGGEASNSFQLKLIYPDEPLGFDEDLEMKLYPNPTQGASVLSLSLREMIDVKLLLRDLSGKTVWQKTFANQSAGNYEYPVGLKDLESGLYYLSVFQGSRIDSLKMIVK